MCRRFVFKMLLHNVCGHSTHLPGHHLKFIKDLYKLSLVALCFLQLSGKLCTFALHLR